LEAGKEKCGADDSPLCFAQIYQLVAENLTAYYLAEDLARGNDYAKSYRATIAEYTERIKRIVDDSDTRDSVLGRLRSYLLPLPDGNNQFDAYISSDKDGFLDTYAFATLALEATKPMPDYDRIKREVSDVLKRVVERNRRHLTDALKDGDSSAIVRLASALKTAQSHLTSAQGLIGE
jgi:hypothetical protein